MDMPPRAAVPAPITTPRWYAHPYNRRAYYRVASRCAQLLPRAGRHALAAGVARFALHCLPAERESVRRNLRRVLLRADARGLDAAVSGVFRNFARCFADLLTINRGPTASLPRYVEEVRGEEYLSAAGAPGHGLVVATAHLGNWELASRLLAARGGRPTHVVLAAEADRAVEGFLRRNTEGVRFVTRDAPTASIALLAALRRNEVVAVQSDRAAGGDADALLPFFGAPAPFPIGPLRLARAAGAPVLPVFCVLRANGTYRIFLEEPIWVGQGGEEAGLRRLVAVLERAVADHPDQWFNFYDVWASTRG